MIQAIGAVGPHSDPEYLRILQELMALGVAPSGNKSTDKAKLERVKAERIQARLAEQQTVNVQPSESVQEAQKSRMEIERAGAMNLAELNKLYFGL